jgi:16S rRNA (guanine527-N7)-methyltransferase
VPPSRNQPRRSPRSDATSERAPFRRAVLRPASSRGSDERQLKRLIDSQPWETIEPYLIGSGAETARAMSRLKLFATKVIHWNRTGSNIMSKHDETRIVTRHLAESLAPAKAIHDLALDAWMDFGSGAGFPAIPLIIAGIGSRWLLVESRRQKTLFLRKMVETLELERVEVATTRLETLESDRGDFDGFTSRATEGLSLTLDLAAKRVRSAGRAFLWRAGSRTQELTQDGPWRQHWDNGQVIHLADSQAEVAEFIRR